MKNKGFTLIELVAIILISATIFLITFPNLLSISRNDKEKTYDSMVDNLCMAGKSYIYSNMDGFKELLEEGNKITINIEDLIMDGYVDNNIKNPKNNKKVKEDNLIYTVLNDKSLNCEYKEG